MPHIMLPDTMVPVYLVYPDCPGDQPENKIDHYPNSAYTCISTAMFTV